MKTITVLVIAIASVVGILLITTLASMMIIPARTGPVGPSPSLKHKESPPLGPSSCPWPNGCHKAPLLSPAGVEDPNAVPLDNRPTSDSYTEKGDYVTDNGGSSSGSGPGPGPGPGPVPGPFGPIHPIPTPTQDDIWDQQLDHYGYQQWMGPKSAFYDACAAQGGCEQTMRHAIRHAQGKELGAHRPMNLAEVQMYTAASPKKQDHKGKKVSGHSHK